MRWRELVRSLSAEATEARAVFLAEAEAEARPETQAEAEARPEAQAARPEAQAVSAALRLAVMVATRWHLTERTAQATAQAEAEAARWVRLVRLVVVLWFWTSSREVRAMALTVFDEGVLYLATKLKSATGLSLQLQRLLFTSPTTITSANVYADLTQPTETGYARRDLSDCTIQSGPASGDVSFAAPAAGMILTGGSGSDSLFGWAVVDIFSTKLMWGDVFASPIQIPATGLTVVGTDTMTVGPHA